MNEFKKKYIADFTLVTSADKGDLALLQNNMLKGEALNNFVKRSIELI